MAKPKIKAKPRTIDEYLAADHVSAE